MNFSKEEIVKIYEIFSRVVDCNGNLKVFKSIDSIDMQKPLLCLEWSEEKKLIKRACNESQKGINITLEDCSNSNRTGKKDKTKNPILSICIRYNNEMPIKWNDFKIAHSVQEPKLTECMETHFSILLNEYQNYFNQNDFEILYKAFKDILYVVKYDLEININDIYSKGPTILYLNTFKNLIDYFKKGEVDFIIAIKKDEIRPISDSEDNGLNGKLKQCFDLYKKLCRICNDIDIKQYKEILEEIENSEELQQDAKMHIKYAYVLKSLTQNCAKNIIYYGAPGTGKTKFVKDCLDILDPSRERTKWIQFHSNFEYEDFIDGIKPTGVSQSGNLVLEMQNGIFKEFCIEVAKENKKRKENSLDLEPYFFIVDEINRANVAAVFGETLSMLEDSYRCEKAAIRIKNSTFIENLAKNNSSKADELSVVWENNQSKFYIPENIYFIGMMNDVDKSIDCFDLALRRRFKWALMKCDYDSLNDIEAKYSGYKAKCESLNDYITKETYKDAQGNSKNDGLNLGRAYEIGHSYFLKRDGLQEKEIWDHYIEPILREYIRSQFGEDEIESKLQTAEKIYTA